jgi:hypothetical protein
MPVLKKNLKITFFVLSLGFFCLLLVPFKVNAQATSTSCSDIFQQTPLQIGKSWNWSNGGTPFSVYADSWSYFYWTASTTSSIQLDPFAIEIMGDGQNTMYPDPNPTSSWSFWVISSNTNDATAQIHYLAMPTTNRTTAQYTHWFISSIDGYNIYADRYPVWDISNPDNNFKGLHFANQTSSNLRIYAIVKTNDDLTLKLNSTGALHYWLSNLNVLNGCSTSTYFAVPTLVETAKVCDSWGFFSPLCRGLVYLIYPSSATMQRFSDLGNVIKDKPPMGYLTSFITAFGTLNASSSPIFTFEDIGDLKDKYFDPFKTGLTWILWILFGIWVIKRIGDFSF